MTSIEMSPSRNNELMINGPENSDPTPEQIAERAKDVRAAWKPKDWSERRVGSEDGWTPPYCSTT